jgi:hypothetical protein
MKASESSMVSPIPLVSATPESVVKMLFLAVDSIVHARKASRWNVRMAK